MTAADPGRYIGVIPSHPLVCIVFIWSDKLWPRMTEAADPMYWVRGLWGSWPVWLDRIPGRMRTQCTAALQGGDAGRVGVIHFADGLLPSNLRRASHLDANAEERGPCAPLRSHKRLGGRRPGTCPRRPRQLLHMATRNGHLDATEQGAHAGPHGCRLWDIGQTDQVQHSGHLLLCSVTTPSGLKN